mgnify:CR=1 FL=1
MSDFEQMVQYWNKTGEWRKSYYAQLKNNTSDKLSMVEKMERELDFAEYIAIDKILKYKRSASLLDVGCGVGRQILDFGNVYKQFQFEGVDISPYQISLLDQEIQNRKIKNIRAKVLDAADIGKLCMRYDVVMFCNNSLGCFDEKRRIQCLKGVKDVLKDDGMLLIGNFGKINIADYCYAEWGISVSGIDFMKEQIDLGVYKSIWKNSKALIQEMDSYDFKCVENIEAGLGGVYIFQNKK